MRQPDADGHEAADGTQGLALARQHTPDLVILDVMLPGVDGFEVCRRLGAQAETSHIPVLMIFLHFVPLGLWISAMAANVSVSIVTLVGMRMQHPPELIPVLLEKWEAGYEVVQTIRKTTEGVSAVKKLTSFYYYKLLNMLSSVHIQEGGSDFRLMTTAKRWV